MAAYVRIVPYDDYQAMCTGVREMTGNGWLVQIVRFMAAHRFEVMFEHADYASGEPHWPAEAA